MAKVKHAAIIVPGVPPSVNHYKRTFPVAGGLRVFTTPEAKAYKYKIAQLIAGREIHADAYAVKIAVFYASHEGDVDNYAKVILDGLAEGGLIRNDRYVTDLHLCKGKDAKNPRVELEVRAL